MGLDCVELVLWVELEDWVDKLDVLLVVVLLVPDEDVVLLDDCKVDVLLEYPASIRVEKACPGTSIKAEIEIANTTSRAGFLDVLVPNLVQRFCLICITLTHHTHFGRRMPVLGRFHDNEIADN